MSSPVEIAVFLDLDNMIISANDVKLHFDVDLILQHVRELTGGRIVLRRAYANHGQSQDVVRSIGQAGFSMQTAVRLNESEKNVADMQLVVDAMETLLHDSQYDVYVLISGDRDFLPLVQALRRLGRKVVGVGLKKSSSGTLVSLCDEFVFYDDLVSDSNRHDDGELADWFAAAVKELLADQDRVQASLVRDKVFKLSGGEIDRYVHGRGGFRRLIERFPDVMRLEREGSTLYVRRSQKDAPAQRALDAQYRSELKKRGLRVVPAKERLQIVQDAVAYLSFKENQTKKIKWNELVETLHSYYAEGELAISKSFINDVMRLMRRAGVIKVLGEASRRLASLPIKLAIEGDDLFKQAIMLCDSAYLRELEQLAGEALALDTAAVALYDSADFANYLKIVMQPADQ